MTPTLVRTATLGDLMAAGIGLYGWCNACGRAGDLDVAALAAAHGESRPWRALARSLRCRRCGAKAGRVRPAPEICLNWSGAPEIDIAGAWPQGATGARPGAVPDSPEDSGPRP